MINFLIKKFVPDWEDTKDAKVRGAFGKLSGTVGILANILLFIIKFIAGIMSGSIAILGDSVNNLSDAGSSIVTLIGFKMSEIPADIRHPYGHGRIEYFSGLIIAVFIMVIGLELLKTSVIKIFRPAPAEFTIFTLAILIISVCIKLWLYLFNNNIGKRTGSKAILATAIDSRNDAVTTMAVLASSAFMYITHINIDGIVGAVVAVFIFSSGIEMVKDTISPLLGERPDEDLVKAIANTVLTTDGILGMHDLMVHDYGPGRLFASLHAEIDSKLDPLIAHDIIDNIELKVKKKLGVDIVIHYDPVITNDPELMQIKDDVERIAFYIDERLSIHDFRMVKGPTHTNIIFDVVTPFGFELTDSELKAKLTEEIKKLDEKYFTVITVDKDFTGNL